MASRFYWAYLEAIDRRRQAQALARLAARAITLRDCAEYWAKAAIQMRDAACTLPRLESLRLSREIWIEAAHRWAERSIRVSYLGETNMRPGDIIQHNRSSARTQWRVMTVLTDGTVKARNIRTGHTRRIVRPEFYRVVKDLVAKYHSA